MEEEIEIQMGDYVFTQRYCIGQGSYGKVYRGRNKRSNRQVAIKEMDGQLITEDEIRKEISILKQLKHPNIVEYEDAFQNNGFFYIVTEYCRGGDLRNLIDSEEEDEEVKGRKILDMFWQVCEGFKYLQGFNIIHRDMKPSNILLDKGLYKIADFGLARRENVHKSVISHDLMGVPIYMSPQILSKNYYTYKCDVWSMGIILFEMLFEVLPWRFKDPDHLFSLILANPYPYKEQKAPNNPILIVLLERTMAFLEKERSSWDELLALKTNKPVNFNSQGEKSRVQSKIFDLSMSKFSRHIAKEEAEMLKSLYSQGRKIQNELSAIANQQFLKSMFTSIIRYLQEGEEWRQTLKSCFLLFFKMLAEVLLPQLMTYERLEDARPLLLFIDTLSGYLLSSQTSFNQSKSILASSQRLAAQNINDLASSVFAKVQNLVFPDPSKER